MSKQNYDSNFCGSLPIHVINHVQAYGFLIVCDLDFTILQVSENVASFIGMDAVSLIRQKLSVILTKTSAELLLQKSVLNQVRVTFTLELASGKSGKNFLVILHKKKDHYLLEWEPSAQEPTRSFLEVYQQIREASGYIQQSNNLKDSLSIAVDTLKSFSGFDKVMIYKFDEDWNGKVVAEAMEPGMESYYGITFPASDIPKQARDLYLKNPFRQIPDRNYQTSKIYPVINPLNQGFVDLSDCNLRGVTKVHLEYLANMNVRSSMSTRILKDNTLWGLIACHHREAKFLNYDEASVFELLSGVISSKLSSEEAKESMEKNAALMGLQSRIIEDIYSESFLSQALGKCAPSIMQLLNCSGLAYSKDSKITSYGECPSPLAIQELVIWLQTQNYTDLFNTSNLSAQYEDASSMSEQASGVIAFPIVPQRGEYIVCFRREILQQIDWGGNPNEAIQFQDGKKNYHPRNSFDIWKEEVRHNSLPFNQYEINFSKDLQRIFIESRLKELNH